MQKMMTYSEANEVLGVSLSPTNRCLSKAVAIANDADADLLADFADARLVPANVVEPGTHWIDEHTIDHYFVDENGDRYGEDDDPDITMAVPLHAKLFVIRTKTLIDGEAPTQEFKGDYADSHDSQDRSVWTRPQGSRADGYGWDEIFTQDSRYTAGQTAYSGIATGGGRASRCFQLSPSTQSDGTALYVINLDKDGSSGAFLIGLNFPSDTVKRCKLQNIIDDWNINATLERYDIGYDVSDGIVELYRKDVGYSKDITVTGFSGDVVVEYFPTETYDSQFTSASVNGNIVTVTRTQEGGTADIYKIYDSNDSRRCIYICARNYNSNPF